MGNMTAHSKLAPFNLCILGNLAKTGYFRTTVGYVKMLIQKSISLLETVGTDGINDGTNYSGSV